MQTNSLWRWDWRDAARPEMRSNQEQGRDGRARGSTRESRAEAEAPMQRALSDLHSAVWLARPDPRSSSFTKQAGSEPPIWLCQRPWLLASFSCQERQA